MKIASEGFTKEQIDAWTWWSTNKFKQFRKNRNKKLSLAYLKCMEEDIKSAKLLIHENINPLSIFHLQQAAEKLAKGMILLDSDKRNLDLYGHDLIEVLRYQFALDEHNTFKYVQKTQKGKDVDFHFFRGALASMMNINAFGKLINGNPKDLYSVQNDVVTNILKEAPRKNEFRKNDRMLNMIKESYKTISKLSGAEIDVLLDYARTKAVSSLYFGKYKDLLNDIAKAYATVTTLNFVLLPHENTTRYPESKDGYLTPNDYYKSSLGVINRFDRLINCIEDTNTFMIQFSH